MRKTGPSLGVLLTGLLLAAWNQIGSATTVFMPTDNNVNVFRIPFYGGATGLLGLFDDSDTGFAGRYLRVNIASDVLTFTALGTDWQVTNQAAQSFTLSGSNHFILGLSQDGGSTWSGDLFASSLGGNVYSIVFPGKQMVFAADVQPVPVPAAAWLFGSGLLGMVAVGRRRARRA
ncbi:MAG: hypothetical protein D6721_04585 [Gammaproteobacteria bacterium]|nr:MAG: hypothetical protein D6721_04585 [Gammaproteobacteria bacterium]